jgi:hypothetical protein
MKKKPILIIGAAGRVGMQIVSELLRRNHHVVMVDMLEQEQLSQRAGRLLNDCRLATGMQCGDVGVYGGIDALNTESVAEILKVEEPDLIINYAIPITWDATKRLPNYQKISTAGLGAFTPIQVITPLKVAEAISDSGITTRYMVGNLPDITIPIINGIAQSRGLQNALCGAGNVGLNQVAMRAQVALELGVAFDEVDVSLVSHHLHWVAPREPGYSNEGPFLAKVTLAGKDITGEFDDLRSLMNEGVKAHYESDASFSSTTGILASRVALALLDDSNNVHQLHTPAPNGLPGGYPVEIQHGRIEVNLPEEWALEDAITAMKHCHTLDGVKSIEADGSVYFTDIARSIVRDELGFDLPSIMNPGDIETVARAQIELLTNQFKRLAT